MGAPTSQVCKPWNCGSAASSLCKAVVPVRGMPVITTGRVMACLSKAGFSAMDLIARARPDRALITSPQAMRRPRSLKCGS